MELNMKILLFLLLINTINSSPLPYEYKCDEAQNELNFFREAVINNSTNFDNFIDNTFKYFNVSLLYKSEFISTCNKFCKQNNRYNKTNNRNGTKFL